MSTQYSMEANPARAIRCPACGALVELTGAQTPCPHCGTVLLRPAAPPAGAPAYQPAAPPPVVQPPARSPSPWRVIGCILIAFIAISLVTSCIPLLALGLIPLAAGGVSLVPVPVFDQMPGSVHGSGVVVEENRTLSNISGVELAMPGTLHIATGRSETLRIEAEDNLLKYIQTDIQAGKLVIQTRPELNLQPTRPINYYLTVDELNMIVMARSGNMEAGGPRSEFFLVTSSAGNLSIGSLDCTSLAVVVWGDDVTISDLRAKSISVEITGSGSLEVLGGQVQQQTINISSSGEYRARDLASVEARVTINSSGSATIRVSDHLSGSLNSSGNVYYIGSPKVNVSTSSAGRAVRISE